MNMLNSFIIEGIVMENASNDTALHTKFNIKHTVVREINGENSEEENIFPVVVYGKTAQFAASKAVKDRTVRIVGRIRVVDDKKWFVVAEHIQYMPLNTNK